MSNPKPLVSIGLPVFNGEDYLQEAIDTILSQTYSNIELIISDNGSTDSTQNICQAAAKKDSRVTYSRSSENKGAAWNYNEVFALSSGVYFKWAAHDDYCHPDFIESCVVVLENRPKCVLSYPRTRVIDEEGNNIAMEEEDLDLSSCDIGKRFICAASESSFRHNPVFGLMRKEVLKKTALIGSYLASDICLLAEMSIYGPFEFIPEELFFRRKRPGNIGVKPEDLEFYDPALKQRIVLSNCRLFQELVKSVWRAHVPYLTKLRLHGTILNWLIRHRGLIFRECKEAISINMEYFFGFGLSDIRKTICGGRGKKIPVRPKSNPNTTETKPSVDQTNSS